MAAVWKIKHILVTNNDGVQTSGLLALVQEMRNLDKVTILQGPQAKEWSMQNIGKLGSTVIRLAITAQ